jgi:probable HAF family extracellular repeat protein
LAAAAISEESAIVSETADGQLPAFLWRGGRMHDLDGGAGDSAAVAINDRGQILGYRGGIAVLWAPRPTR